MIDELLTWVRDWDGYTKLNAIVTETNDLSIVISDRAVLNQFTDGTKEYEMSFALVAMLDYSNGLDDVNKTASEYMESWNNWLEAKDDSSDYPAIGIVREVTASVPVLALTYQSDQLAKYTLQAKIRYVD